MVAASYGAWLEPHNLYVTILGDFGIVGLCLFLTPFAVALFRYVSAFLRGREGPLERFGLFFLVGPHGYEHDGSLSVLPDLSFSGSLYVCPDILLGSG